MEVEPLLVRPSGGKAGQDVAYISPGLKKVIRLARHHTMNDLAFTLFAGISLLLVLLPLSLHWRVGNMGTVFLLLWCFVTCFVHFMNSILWWGSTEVFARVWCDICEA